MSLNNFALVISVHKRTNYKNEQKVQGITSFILFTAHSSVQRLFLFLKEKRTFFLSTNDPYFILHRCGISLLEHKSNSTLLCAFISCEVLHLFILIY